MKTAVFMVAAASLALFSCSKDEVDVEQISEKVSLEGRWQIETVTSNGADVTAAFQEEFGCDHVLQMEKNKTYRIEGTVNDETVEEEGTWTIEKTDHESKKRLIFQPSTPGSYYREYTIEKMCGENLEIAQPEGEGQRSFKYKH